ncbi:MAG: hypothetical protein WKF68_08405 [Daejeonella sp.]
MNLPSDLQLSTELQELHLQNKQWLSDVLFLDNETRFFQKLFNKILLTAVKDYQFDKIQFLNVSLNELEERRNNLRSLVNHHQRMVESMIKDPGKKIGLELISENTEIVNEIQALCAADKLVKKELYSLAEEVIRKEKSGHLLKA